MDFIEIAKEGNKFEKRDFNLLENEPHVYNQLKEDPLPLFVFSMEPSHHTIIHEVSKFIKIFNDDKGENYEEILEGFFCLISNNFMSDPVNIRKSHVTHD